MIVICQSVVVTRRGLLAISHGAELEGGAEFVFDELVKSLATAGDTPPITVVVPAEGEMASLCRRAGIEVVIRPVPRWADFRKIQTRGRVRLAISLVPGTVLALCLIGRTRPIAVLTNTMTIPSHAIAARIFRIPHFWLVHEFGDRDHGLSFVFGKTKTLQWLAGLSSEVICCSVAVERAVLDAAPDARTRVIYPGVRAPALPPRRRAEAGALRLILVGRYAESKGQDLALQALAAVVSRGANVSLTLVGPGDRTPFVKMASVLGLTQRVTMHGLTSDVLTYVVNADVALMCSRDEAFGRVTVEAMRRGLPVCGTRSGGTTEIISHGVNGLLSSPGDIEGLAANIEKMLDDDERFRMAKGAAATAAQFASRDYGSDIWQVVQERSIAARARRTDRPRSEQATGDEPLS